jgi:hypothetical protein
MDVPQSMTLGSNTVVAFTTHVTRAHEKSACRSRLRKVNSSTGRYVAPEVTAFIPKVLIVVIMKLDELLGEAVRQRIAASLRP